MAKVAEVFIGARFGRLVVIGERGNPRPRHVLTRCDCGTVKLIHSGSLGNGSLSCGCKMREESRARATTHGLSRRPEFSSWTNLINRCTNPRDPSWKNYGGRGIAVCDEWRHDFKAFFNYVGPRPTRTHSIDRINVDGNYEPGNVRWATPSQQAQNKRKRLVCKRGHRIEGDNEGFSRDGDRIRRYCRRCARMRKRSNRALARAEGRTYA